MSGSESWGRWSDANLAPSVLIDLKNQLPNSFNLDFIAQPFGPNAGQDLVVRVGSQLHNFNLKSGAFEYRKTIDLRGKKVTRIEFFPPRPLSPNQLKLSTDSRMLGIGLIRLRFEDISTTEITSHK